MARHSIDWDVQSSWSDSAGLIVISWIIFEVIAVAISCGFALHFGRTLGFDITNYQFVSGEGQIRGLDAISGLGGQLQTFTDVQMNGLYFLLITHESPRFVVLAIAFLQSLSVSVIAGGVFALSLKRGVRIRWAYVLSLVVLAATIAMPNYLSELGGTGSDSLLVLPLAIAFMLLWSLITAKNLNWESWVIALIAGLLIGTSIFLKFTNGPWGLGLICGFILAFCFGESTRLLGVWRKLGYVAVLCGSTLLAFCIGYGSEAVFLWRRYRDPFFPYFGKLFHSADLLPIDFRDNRFSVKSLPQAADHVLAFLKGGNNLASFPARSPLVFFGLVAIFVSFIFTIFGDRSAHRQHKLFIQTSCLVGFAFWMYSFGIYRYMAPFEIALPGLLVALGLLHNFRRAAIPVCVGILLRDDTVGKHLSELRTPAPRFWILFRCGSGDVFIPQGQRRGFRRTGNNGLHGSLLSSGNQDDRPRQQYVPGHVAGVVVHAQGRTSAQREACCAAHEHRDTEQGCWLLQEDRSRGAAGDL